MSALEKSIDTPAGDTAIFWRLISLSAHWPIVKDAVGGVLNLHLMGWKTRAAWVAGKQPSIDRQIRVVEGSTAWTALMGVTGKNPPSQAQVLAWLKTQVVPAPTPQDPAATVPGEFFGATDAAE